ncbi:MAG: alanine dehydrogenase [Cytophagales bacterium]
MKLGVPKEIKSNENRVGITPQGVRSILTKFPQTNIYIQKDAGLGSGFSNNDYISAGAIISENASDVFSSAELIVKVKEPLENEYELINDSHTVFTYFHFASSKILTHAMIKSRARCIAYETVKKPDGSLPLLTPMSEVAGRLAIQQGAKYLEKIFGGKGKLLGGIPGIAPATVLIFGGGVVGTQAAKMAAGLGANVIIFEQNPIRIRQLCDILPANVTVLYAHKGTIINYLPLADLIIGAVLIPGAQAPKLLTESDLKLLQKGTVLVDVAIDQGGCFETSKATTHNDPIYEIDGIVHYCVANMPGAVPQTSTMGLTAVTLPYIESMIQKGITAALESDESLRHGLSLENGIIIDPEIQKFMSL